MSVALPGSMREYIDNRVAAGNHGDTSEYFRDLVRRDQQGEVRYDHKEGGGRVAVKLANATNAALDQIEPDPGIGSPTLGRLLGIPGLRTWRVSKFPLLSCYFELGEHLDVVRLPGERQDLGAILGDEFAEN